RGINLGTNSFAINSTTRGVGFHVDQADGARTSAIGDYGGVANGHFIAVDDATGKMYLKGGGIEGVSVGALLEVLNPATGEIKFANNANTLAMTHSLFTDTLKVGGVVASITNRAQVYDEFL